MNVYHGSFIDVPSPDTVHSRKNVDFGQGFYVTPIYEQARKWAEKFSRQGKDSVVSSYIFDESACNDLKILRFETYSEEWLDFIALCRSLHDSSDYDIVIGGVANDKVFNTLELFFDGLINKKEAIGRLIYEKPNLQICFRTQISIDKVLHFVRSDKL